MIVCYDDILRHRLGRKQAATLVFIELYTAFFEALENISEWLGVTSDKASMYLRCMDPSLLFSAEVQFSKS